MDEYRGDFGNSNLDIYNNTYWKLYDHICGNTLSYNGDYSIAGHADCRILNP